MSEPDYDKQAEGLVKAIVTDGQCPFHVGTGCMLEMVQLAAQGNSQKEVLMLYCMISEFIDQMCMNVSEDRENFMSQFLAACLKKIDSEIGMSITFTAKTIPPTPPSGGVH